MAQYVPIGSTAALHRELHRLLNVVITKGTAEKRKGNGGVGQYI